MAQSGMSFAAPHEIASLTLELIQKWGLKENTARCNKMQKKALDLIAKAPSAHFVDKKDLDGQIDGLCEKFLFHGFCLQAEALKRCYESYTNQQDAELTNRLNVIQVLLLLSVSPTNNMLPTDATIEDEDETTEAITDWGAYMREGIPRWSPTFQDSDSTSTDCGSIGHDTSDDESKNTPQTKPSLVTPLTSDQIEVMGRSYQQSRLLLLEHIQNGWFKEERVRETPPSRWFDANVQYKWEDHLSEITHDLIDVHTDSVISEYKVMREILWQLRGPHKSFVFEFNKDDLIVRPDVTIASMRTEAFHLSVSHFLRYIEVLDVFRRFCKGAMRSCYDFSIAGTYGSYAEAIEQILAPVYDKLIQIEDEIRIQEATWTLIKLDFELDALFRPVFLLEAIHKTVLSGNGINTPRSSAKSLLNGLCKGLRTSFCTDEEILYVTLYISTLFKYFALMETWLKRGRFFDNADEFPLVKSANCNAVLDAFAVHQEFADDAGDYITKIIRGPIVQIGKNLHLLQKLEKWQLLSETAKYKKSMYEDFIDRITRKIADYFGKPYFSHEDLIETTEMGDETTFAYPATCPDHCKYQTERDRLENLVDTSNVFLMAAFEDLLKEEPKQATIKKPSLYETIKNLIDSMFPIHVMLGTTFAEILEERYFHFGHKVKEIFVEELEIVRHFDLLKHLFLLKDDLIGPLYRMLFYKFETSDNPRGDVMLTSQLQDLLMDNFPDFYYKCSVDVSENWHYINETLDALSKFKIKYEIKWPLNIVIRSDDVVMYTHLFQFLMKLKWASYTLNNLNVTDLTTRNRHKRIKATLQLVRFGLIHLVNNIQQYIFGYVYEKNSKTFDDELENSYDIETLISSHQNFVKTMHADCVHFENSNESHGFTFLLYLIRRLDQVWKDPEQADLVELTILQDSYQLCYKNLDPMSNPMFFVM